MYSEFNMGIDQKIIIKMLKASNGDSFIISWKDEAGVHKIIIDTGIRNTAKVLIKEIESSDKIDALFITHVCNDHIGGIIKLLRNNAYLVRDKIHNIYINSPETIETNSSGNASVNDGYNLLSLLKEKNLESRLKACLAEDADIYIGNASITILSPSKESIATKKMIRKWKESTKKSGNASSFNKHTKESFLKIEELSKLPLQKAKSENEDYINASSMAFIFKVNKKSILLLGDSHPNSVINMLEKKALCLKFDAVKVSHHGSQYNINEQFLEKVKSQNYIISTNGGRGSSKHPDSITLAKLFKSNIDEYGNINFFFNYPQSNFNEHLKGFIEDSENYTNLCLNFDQKEVVI